jgi:hypothetical protein
VQSCKYYAMRKIYIYILILNTINILINKNVQYHYKIWSRETVLIPNTTSLWTTLAVEEHLAEGWFLLEEQMLKKQSLKSWIYQEETWRQFPKGKGRIQNYGKLEYETLHQGDSYSYVKYTSSTLKHKDNCNGHEQRND